MTRQNRHVPDLSAYTEEGIRMLKVVCFAMGWGDKGDEIDLEDLFSKYLGDHMELSDVAGDWANAAGFTYCYWDRGGQIAPYAEDFDFSEIVSDQAFAADGGFEFSVYDRNGRLRELKTTIVSVLGGVSPYGNDEGYDEWAAGAPKRAAAKAKKAKAAMARKAKKKAYFDEALASLTPKQRKVLGL